MIAMTELGKEELRGIAELEENRMFESTDNVFIARDLEDEEFLILDFNRGWIFNTGYELSLATWLSEGYITHIADPEEYKEDIENFKNLILDYHQEEYDAINKSLKCFTNNETSGD